MAVEHIPLNDFMKIVSLAADGYLLIDSSGRILEADDGYCRLSGYTRAELLGMEVADLEMLEDQAVIMARIKRVRGGCPDRFDSKHRRKDGAPLSLSIRIIHSADNDCIHVFFKDISAENLHHRIQSARQRLQEYSPTGTLDEVLRTTIDEAEELTGSSVGFCHFFEEDRQVLMLQAWSTRTSDGFCHAEKSSGHYPLAMAGVWADCIRERQPVIHNDLGSLPHRRGMPDGHAEITRELVVPILRNDRIVAVLGVGNKPGDYTREDLEAVAQFAEFAWPVIMHRKNELQLLENDKRFRALVQASSDVVYRMSPDWVEMRHLVGRDFIADMEEPTRTWLDRYIPPEDQAHVTSVINDAIRSRKTFELEHRVRRVDGSLGWTSSRAVPVLDEKGDIIEWFGMASDITERKQTESALRRSEARYRLLADTMLHGIVHQKADGTIIAMNPAAEQILGRTSTEFIGSSSVNEEHRTVREDGSPFPGHEHPAMVALRTGQAVHGVVMGVRNPQRNELRWIEVDAVPLFMPGQIEAAEVYTVFSDITERKQAEDAILASQAKLHAALESMTDAVFISDNKGNFIDFNEAFARFHKFGSKDVCAKKLSDYPAILDVFMADGTPAPLDQWAVPRALRGETVVNAEYSLRRKDTGETWVGSYSFAPIRVKNGTIVGSVVVGRDITEQKKVQNALIESERRLAEAQRVSHTGSWEWDLRTGKVIWSDELYSIYGLKRGSFQPSIESFLPFVHPDDFEAVQKAIKQALSSGLPVDFEFRIRRPDGPVRILRTIGKVTAYDAQGQPDVMIGINMDITDRRLVEEKLKEKSDDLEKSFEKIKKVSFELVHAEERERERIAGELHDQVGHSLLLARMKLALLERSCTSDALSNALKEIEGILGQCISDIRSLTFRMRPPLLETAGLDMTFNWLCSTVGSDHNATINYSSDGSINKLPPDLRYPLYQAVRELLINAMKHANAGKVQLDARTEDGVIAISVIDDGEGFARHTSGNDLLANNSLGLFNVQQRVERLNGSLTIESEPGKGTVVTLRIPGT